jgi:hypothetical protein
MINRTYSGASRSPFRRQFFICMALLMLLAIAMGFGKSFFLRPMFNSKPLPLYLMLHGITMTAWFLLFLVQASLVSARRVDLHRKLGVAGLLLAAGVVITGVVVNLNVIPRMLELGQISRPEEGVHFALSSLSGLLPFAVLVLLAVGLRRNTGVHKRLMFWSFVWVLGPAFTNTRPLGQFLDPLVAPYLPFFPADFIWLFLLMAYDWITERRIYPATYAVFVLLALFFLFATPWIAGNEILQGWLLAQVENHAS